MRTKDRIIAADRCCESKQVPREQKQYMCIYLEIRKQQRKCIRGATRRANEFALEEQHFVLLVSVSHLLVL